MMQLTALRAAADRPKTLGMPGPTQPLCTLVEESAAYRAPELESMAFDGCDLTLRLGVPLAVCQVVFREVIGFRVLDERDLLEFWNTYSQPHGWLWRVVLGGWLALERSRPQFDVAQFYSAAEEYLVVGDTCVSIITEHPPKITSVGALSVDA